MTKQSEVSCPTCNKKNTWQKDNPHKPFCSDRCKLIDLGDWAAEKHAIPGKPAADEWHQIKTNKNSKLEQCNGLVA